MTSTLDGASVPAAVMSKGKNFPNAPAARMAARYPAIELCDDSASMDCARAMRGMASMLKAVMRFLAWSSVSSGLSSGWRNAISAEPSASRSASCSPRSTFGIGWRTFTTTSAFPNSSAVSDTIVAPASW